MQGSSREPKVHIIQLESRQYNQMMNPRGAWLSGREQNPTPAPANDPRSHRLPRRFFTALQDSQRQQDQSVCPSIENELPSIVITPSEMPFQQLMNEIQLKDKALGKATIMIDLLRQENRQLSSQIALLQAQVSGKQKTIDELIQNMDISRRVSPYDPIVHTQSQAFPLTSRTNHSHRRKSKSELFQQYTQAKPMKQKIATTTLYPSLAQTQPQLLFTKQLTPYQSQHLHKETWTILQQIASKTIQVEISKNKELIRSMEELIEEEGQIFYHKMNATAEQIKEIEEDSSFFNMRTDDRNSSSVIQILQQYRRVVEIYRQYSAYLRSYLCQIINFLSQTMEQSYPSINFSKLIKLVKNRLSQVLHEGLQQVKVQNKQLKVILQQLIHNWQLTKQNQSIIECPTCSSAKAQAGMKQLQ